MTKPRIAISDHALIRYIERVQGVSLDPMRRELEAMLAPAMHAGACSKVVNGFTYMFRKGVDEDTGKPMISLATIYSPEMRRQSLGARRIPMAATPKTGAQSQ